jgi:hypothetical protein
MNITTKAVTSNTAVSAPNHHWEVGTPPKQYLANIHARMIAGKAM